jgi:putative ABC transport system permease protein
MSRLPTGAKVGSFTRLSLRSLRARPLRSFLTATAIALGVGMVFGVLLLVGTIHSTFDRLYDSIYGRTDVVVSGQQEVGSLPAGTIDRVRAVQGVESAAGQIWSIFRTVAADQTVSRAQSGQLYVVGVDYRDPDPTDAKQTAGRNPVPGRGEVELQADWAAEHDLRVGAPLRLSTPSGIVTLRVAGLYAFQGGLDLGGYGTASMPVEDARPIMDKRGVWDEIDVVAADGVGADVLRARLDAALGRGVEVATPQSKSDEIQDQLASLDVVLYFFSGIALFVGTFLILNSFNMTVLQRMR